MDWYIFLAPLLLVPIIFLFRLVGCTQDFDALGRGDGAPDQTPDQPPYNITFILNIVDGIPFIDPNPIYYIFPKFTIDDGDPIEYPQLVDSPPQEPFTAGVGLNPFKITTDPVQVPWTGLDIPYICSCDVYWTRTGIELTDDQLNKPLWTPEQHVTGPASAQVPFDGQISNDISITFKLTYTRTEGATDYLPTDFHLTLDNIA
jgi:hypothetical protein